MTILIWGMVLFFGIHLFSMTPLREGVVVRLGLNPYKGLYSLVSIVGLGLMIWGFSRAQSGPDAFPFYELWPEGRHVMMLMVLVALILLAASHMKGHIKKIVRHPMSAGIALWASAHLLVNDKLSELLFFGGFLGLAVLDIIVSSMRGKGPKHEPQVKHDIIAVLAGAALFAVILMLHQRLFGVSPML